MAEPRHPRHLPLAATLALLAALMVGAAFASVPLYKLFCQVTGFDGTTQRASGESREILDRTALIRFDTNVRGLPWTFTAEQTSQTLRIGQTGMAFFKVTNTSDRPITGQATYNVVPESAGAYFRKLQCFCFNEQTIAAGETVEFPMIYFVDPEITRDFETKGVDEITLSYTFFPAVGSAPGKVQASAPKPAEPLGGERRAGL
jgi:cytochrome c oxidase assembly protein subunit 11